MPVIGQRTFINSPTTDRYISLANEEFVRQLNWTPSMTGFTAARVCMNAAIRDSGGGNITGSLFVGLCSGTTFPFGSNSCLNACGHWNSGTWNYNAGTNPYYSCGGHNRYQKIGTNISSNGPGGWTGYIPTTGGAIQRRGWYGPRIAWQAATSVYVGQLTQDTSTAQLDVSNEQFLYSTSQGANTPYVLEVSASLSGPVAITTPAGWNTNPLNAIDIYWSNSQYPLEIYMLAVTLYY
jgi:hypothetical protein